MGKIIEIDVRAAPGYVRGMSEVTISQIRAARGMLGWTQMELARRAGIAQRSLSLIETGQRPARASTLDALRRALEAEGITWIGTTGVDRATDA